LNTEIEQGTRSIEVVVVCVIQSGIDKSNTGGTSLVLAVGTCDSVSFARVLQAFVNLFPIVSDILNLISYGVLT